MAETKIQPRLKERYKNELLPKLMEEFKIPNLHMAPRLEKIVVNMGVGEGAENKKRVEAAMVDLASITGQQPKMCRARVSVANFKLREGMPIGCKVDLRGDRMYEFLDRLISMAIPRIRDFRGIPSNSFDGRGNFSMGLTEQSVFPEVNLDRVEWTQGMDITMVMSGGNDEMAFALLKGLGMPFKSSGSGT